MSKSRRELRLDFGWATVALVSIAAAIFAVRCTARFAGAGHDDTFITLLAADTLAHGEGLVSSDGRPGEISSSLLHVLLLALLSLLGISDLYLGNKCLGLFFGVVTVGLVLVANRLLFPDRARLIQLTAAACAALAFTSLPTALYWTMGGLETPLVMLLVTWLAVELARDPTPSLPRVAIVSTLLVLARPEGWIYMAAVALFALGARLGRRWLLRAVATPVAAFVLLSLVRKLWFGVWLPLPALAKMSSSAVLARINEGLAYLWAFAEASYLGFVLLCAALAAACLLAGRTWRERGRGPSPESRALLAVVSVVGVHLLTVALSGGDWMGYYRFVAPAVPLLGVTLAQLISAAAPRSSTGLVSALLVLVGISAVPLGEDERSGLRPPYMQNTCLQTSLADLGDAELGPTLGERVRRLNHPYLRDLSQLAPFVHGPLQSILRVKPDILIASYQMGYFPYHARIWQMPGIRFLDTVGITDSQLAKDAALRSSRGLSDGLEPRIFLDPQANNAVSNRVQALRPDLTYVLNADVDMVSQLTAWGWLLVWNAPEAKIFARRELLLALRPRAASPERTPPSAHSPSF